MTRGKRFLKFHCGWLLATFLSCWFVPTAGADEPQEVTGEATPAATESEANEAESETKSDLRPWLSSLEEGRRQALANGAPLLIRTEADWCPACRALKAEIAKADVQKELARWTLVEIDVDQSPEDAQRLNVNSIPTLHIQTPGGRAVVSRVGAVSAEELVAWLTGHHAAAAVAPDDVLLAVGEPDVLAVLKLVRQFGDRDPAVRQAAIGRLVPYRAAGGGSVLGTFRDGDLASRLTALELLDLWKAPIDGLDPWQPETLSPERLARLDKWLEQADAEAESEAETETESEAETPGEPEPLSEEALASAREQIERMLRVGDSEAAAIRGRLARLGPALLEEIYRQLQQADTDGHRERLRALRYRVVASDALVLRWPGGLARLAATDSAERQKAAEELAKRATSHDQALLLELFSDPDPLVREISLRGLQHIGGKESVAALVRLLSDPEPNVRAAVLKLLEETPDASMVPKVAAYLKTEEDPDLIVHAIRFLRATGGETAIRSLMALLKHESWQVRAEAAAGIGKSGNHFAMPSPSPFGSQENSAEKLQADAYVALLELLDDEDAFVVSRAVEGLSGADMVVAVEPLVNAAAKNPDLAVQIVEMLARGEKMRPKALPHLRKFTTDEEPAIRAAALGGLYRAVPNGMQKELLAGLDDQDSSVRTVAAGLVFDILEQSRRQAQQKVLEQEVDPFGDVGHTSPVQFTPAPSLLDQAAAALKAFGSALGGSAEEAPKPADPGTEEPPIIAPPSVDLPSLDRPSVAPLPIRPSTIAPPADDEPADGPGEPQPAEPDEAQPDDEQPQGEAESEEESAEESVDPWDQWLLDFYAGKGRPAWMEPTIEPLRKMLAAEQTEEHAAAAAALVPLGRADEALPVLLAAAAGDSKQLQVAAGVLPWLVWDTRREVFEQLRAQVSEEDDLSSLAEAMVTVADRRAVDLFWELLGEDYDSPWAVRTIDEALRKIYVGDQYYYSEPKIPASVRREIVEMARPHSLGGTRWQRIVAMALMLLAAPDEAVQAARQVVDDPEQDEELRREAFTVLLAASPRSERMQLAVGALADESLPWRKTALSYLVQGDDSLGYAGGWIRLNPVGGDSSTMRRSGQPIVPEPPAGLKVEDVHPLLDDPDPEVAGYAGYLVALFGDRAGLDPLLRYWHEQGSYGTERLVYRAIAILNATDQVPELTKIYEDMDRYEVDEFYWTIRIMGGPEILRLRKRIRDEVGMSSLQ